MVDSEITTPCELVTVVVTDPFAFVTVAVVSPLEDELAPPAPPPPLGAAPLLGDADAAEAVDADAPLAAVEALPELDVRPTTIEPPERPETPLIRPTFAAFSRPTSVA